MWSILEHRHVIKNLKKCPKEVIFKYEALKRIIELQGPSGLKTIKGFHNEALEGVWKDARFSRLGIMWRVIYQVLDKRLEILVIELSPHKY